MVTEGETVGALVTCIVAVVDGGRVHMAADQMAVESNGLTMAIPKLVARDGTIVGVAGMSRTLPLVRRQFPMDPEPDQDLDRWAQAWAEQVTAAQLEAGIVDGDNEHDTYGAMILARAGACWEIGTGVANLVTCGYHSIGSGDAVAIGALWALARDGRTGPEIARLAVEAAAAHQIDVGGHIDTAST